MDIEADNNSTKKLNRKSSILFPTENTTKIFFSPSTLEDLDISIDKGEKENQTFLVPSIEDLVEADLQCCDTIELENTADFLLADDSFDYFCKKSSKIESPEIQSLSPKTETISVSKFLSENGIQFCIFNRVPRKISLGYPSDSLTSLLSFAVDTDPSLSIEHIKLKKWILKKNLEQRFIFNTESEFLTDECSLEISEIENNLSFQNPKCFSCFNTQIGKRTSLKQLQRNCTLFSKKSWYLRLYEYHKKVNSLLTVLQDSIKEELKKMEELILNATDFYQENELFCFKNEPCTNYEILKDSIVNHIDCLDTMYGLIHWKIVKSDILPQSKTRTLILRFCYSSYELSIRSCGNAPLGQKTKFSCLFYRNGSNPSNYKKSLLLEQVSKYLNIIFYF